MTREESEVIQQSLAGTMELLDGIIAALGTVQNSVTLMAEGLENVEQNLLSIARLVRQPEGTPIRASGGEPPEPPGAPVGRRGRPKEGECDPF
jgi:hypothetical protein